MRHFRPKYVAVLTQDTHPNAAPLGPSFDRRRHGEWSGAAESSTAVLRGVGHAARLRQSGSTEQLVAT